MKPFLDLCNILRTLLSVAVWLGKIRSKLSIPPFRKTSWSKLLYDHYYLLTQKPKQTGSEYSFGALVPLYIITCEVLYSATCTINFEGHFQFRSSNSLI